MAPLKRFSDQINFLGRANCSDGNVGVEPTHLGLAGKSSKRGQQKTMTLCHGFLFFGAYCAETPFNFMVVVVVELSAR
jgi:hypothetical protein